MPGGGLMHTFLGLLCILGTTEAVYTLSKAAVSTTEGTTDTLGLRLNFQPTATVTIGVSSSNLGEGTLDRTQFVFTSADFGTFQTMTITGVQDAIDDINGAYTIDFAPMQSADGNFNGQQITSVPATNANDDVTGMTITPTAGITTTEALGQAEIVIVLNTQPIDDVQLTITSSDTTEGVVDGTGVITFTAGVGGIGRNHWSTPQTVTITGVNDLVADGNQPYNVLISSPTSNDAKYAALAATTITAINVDNDSPGVSVTPTSGLTTTEAGGSTAFSVVLNTEPAGDVTIFIASNNLAEGFVVGTAPHQLVFTQTDWSTPQIVTIQGEQDSVQDGNVVYTVQTTTSAPTDPRYDRRDETTVTITNMDDDTAGVTVTPTSGLVTTEGLTSATFSVVLNSAPTSDVSIDLSSSDTTEGQPTVSQLVFQTTNWDTPRIVRINGVDDQAADGDIPYTIVLAAARSTDLTYSGIDPSDVTFVNTDNDVPGMTLTPSTGLVTSEDPTVGGATFVITLDTEPISDVVVDLASADLTEATTNPSQVVFSTTTWNTPVPITVTGVDDMQHDGDMPFTIIATIGSTTDPKYVTVLPRTVTGVNRDDDTAGIVVTSPIGGLLRTSEIGGQSTFQIRLATQPSADVVIDIYSTDTSEAIVSDPQLIFTMSTWSIVRTVTVTGVQDAIDDDDQPFEIRFNPAVSTDTSYSGSQIAAIPGENTDDDVAGINILPATNPLQTSELQQTATFTVTLSTQPTADVTIGISSSDVTEGVLNIGVTELVFHHGTNTPGANHWSNPQTVTITGVNDDVADGTVAYTINTAIVQSTDLKYSGINPIDVQVQNLDDDNPGILITSAAGLTTRELGSKATYAMLLQSEPTDTVTVAVLSNDTTEAVPSPATIDFNSSNWNVPRLVTITGVDDSIQDGDVVFQINHQSTSLDVNYQSNIIDNVVGINLDDDTAGVWVRFLTNTVSSLETSENLTPDHFLVSLRSEPVDLVQLQPISNDTTEASVPSVTLVFSSLNWDVQQTVVVTGVDDTIQDGLVPFQVSFLPSVSNDPNYNALQLPDTLVGFNSDNDVAGITVSHLQLTVNEGGLFVNFTVNLNTTPTADVTVFLNSGDHTEGLVSPTQLLFTDLNWDTPQQVQLTGQDDLIADGDKTFNVYVGPSSSADANYVGVSPVVITAENLDDDSSAITVSPTFLTVSEGGGQADFTVRLTSQPLFDVRVFLTNNNTAEATLSTNFITFTPGSWDSPAVVTVTGRQDSIDDDDVSFFIVTESDSLDSVYHNIAVPDVAVTNTDDDTSGITVTTRNGNNTLNVTEDGTITDTFSVVLMSQPTADVTVSLVVRDPSELTVSAVELVFTPGGVGVWSTPQTVTVTGVNDLIDDGNVESIIDFQPVVSSDAKYNSMALSQLFVTTADDDLAGINVNPGVGVWNTIVREEGVTSTFFIIQLNSQPIADIDLLLQSNDTTEGNLAANSSSVTFTTSDWDIPQTIIVDAVDDDVADGDVTFAITASVVSTTDPAYNFATSPDVYIQNIDNDNASIIISNLSIVTEENGPGASFSVQLSSEPLFDVTVPAISGTVTEGQATPATLVFNQGNWNVPQLVSVTGVDDFVADGPQNYEILTVPVVSADPSYNNIASPTVKAVNIDDDTPSVVVGLPTPSSSTEETGTQVTFVVQLSSEPVNDVLVRLVSGDHTEGTVFPTQFTFTNVASNWSTAQTVTVTGVDDSVADGDVTYSVITELVTSNDPKYNGIDPPNVLITNIDNDSPGISIIDGSGNSIIGLPTSALSTSEAGLTSIFVIKLESEPSADVSIDLISRDSSEGILSTSRLVFSPGTWDAPLTVTINPVQDAVDDGDVTYPISLIVGTMDTTGYASFSIPDILVTNIDDDTKDVTITPTAGLVTTEAGGKAEFTVVVHTQPSHNLSIDFTSSMVDEGVVFPTRLTFLPGACPGPCPVGTGNWNAPLTVTVTGVNDQLDDGDIVYDIRGSNIVSLDTGYSNLPVQQVQVTNIDDDVSGVIVAPASPFFNQNTREDGTSVEFIASLASRPTGDVAVHPESNDTTEGTPSPTILTFTVDNWNISQTVTITGVNDFVADGDVIYSIVCRAQSAVDVLYDGALSQPIEVLNIDDDSPGITITDSASAVIANNVHITTESGNVTGVNVALNSEPLADVTVTFRSTDVTEGDVRLVNNEMIFSSVNWNVVQTMVIQGEDDTIQDGDQPYQIEATSVSSVDPTYNTALFVMPPPIQVVNSDDDSAAVLVSPVSGLVTSETGDTATFSVSLNSTPSSDVLVPIKSGDHTEGAVFPPSLTFTPQNWSSPQVVTITGQDDQIDDGSVLYFINIEPAITTDLAYRGITGPSVSVNNTDDDNSAGEVCILPLCSCCSGRTSEDGTASLQFTVALRTQPTDTVTIGVVSSDASEGVASPNQLIFTPGSWDTPRTISVVGVQDAVDDGDVQYSIILQPAVSSDPNFSGMDLTDITMTNTDDDTAGITVSKSSFILTEAQGTAHQESFTVVLHTQPTSDVTVNIETGDATEGVVDKQQLVFTPTVVQTGQIDWATPQVVTVTAVDDDFDDGDITFPVMIKQAISNDIIYNNMNAADIQVTTLNDETAGIVVTPTGALWTNIFGGTAIFTVSLSSRPQADVTIPTITSSNTQHGTVSPSSLIFTPATWRTPQSVTITGVDDQVNNGDQSYQIIFGTPISNDAQYTVISPPTVDVVNRIDSGSPGVTPPPTPSPPGTTPTPGSGLFCSSFVSQQCQLRTDAASVPCAASGCEASLCCSTCLTYAGTCTTGTLDRSAICGIGGCTATSCCITTTTSSSDDGLEGWEIALIVIGSVLCLILLIALLYCLSRGKKKKKSQSPERNNRHFDDTPAKYNDPYAGNFTKDVYGPVKDTYVPEGQGDRYVGRWSETQGKYYFYPEGAKADNTAVWELPPGALPVAWKGGPNDGMSDPMPVNNQADPYNVTPLPSSRVNPLNNLYEHDSRYG
eukprot:TRINITY_DN864_c0_g2_i1.p1 TRINITY_DN864_c0_g2~~TRINITY_DN864_c0_g2_i1.p1  ORF type:complete len:2974 (+),score=629.32 TRINITY_DN864_c0_g2_i1:53-8974(+)